MGDLSGLGLITAFAAGAVSFLSPCVLPLVPAYMSYVAGQSLQGSEMDVRSRAKAAALSAFFILGFGLVFVALGAGATALGGLLLRYRYEANIVGGVIVVLFGLFMLGLARHVAWFHRDLRLHPRLRGGNPMAALVLGLAFGFGWTPCIGPVLGAILTVSAVENPSSGIGLLAAYALGLGVPFLLAAVFMRELVGRLKAFRHAGRPLQIVAGIVMVLVGVAILTGQLGAFSIWLLKTFPALGRVG